MKKITISIVLALLCLFKKIAKRPKCVANGLTASHNEQKIIGLMAKLSQCEIILEWAIRRGKHFSAILLLLTICVSSQAQENEALDVTLKGVQIGQKVPDVTITGLHNYRDANGKPATTAKLSDFKGKLLILDLWATWCSPCVAMIPKMDSLQKAFGDKIQFLSVTYQTENEVLPFLRKFEKQQGKHYNLPVVTADKELHKLFPHVYLPHYVWIDGNGVVKAITGYSDINAANITKLLAGDLAISRKRDHYRPYDFNKAIHANFEGTEFSPLCISTLSGFVDGVGGGSSVKTDRVNGRRITLVNVPLIWLYEFAFRDKGLISSNRISIQTIDSNKIATKLKGQAYLNWLKDGNGYCYELQVSPQLIKTSYDRLRSDMAYLFPQYTAKIEKTQKEIYALRRTSVFDKIKSKGESYQAVINKNEFQIRNSYLVQLINELNMVYQQRSKLPIVDQTGYSHKVDLSLTANLSNMDDINKALERYDLKFVKSIEYIDVLTISDTPKLLSATN